MVWVQLRDPASVNKVLSSQRRLLTATIGLHIHIYTNACMLCLPEQRCVNVHPFIHMYTHLYTRFAHLNIDMWVCTLHTCIYTSAHTLLTWTCVCVCVWMCTPPPPHMCIHICMHTPLTWTCLCECASLIIRVYTSTCTLCSPEHIYVNVYLSTHK